MLKSFIHNLSGIAIILVITLSSCKTNTPKASENSFSFVFMTDIHLQPELNAPQGFKHAMDSVNSLNPDFVITGGDLIMDALGQSYERSDSLYNLYQEMIPQLKMPVYNTLGNHEIYGIYKESGADVNHPEYGEKMYEKRLGKSYYSFDHKGWKFIIMNSIEDTRKSSYIGWVNSIQMNWIKQELDNTPKETPIVISTHIPFITAFKQKYYGSTLMNDSSLVVANSKEVIDLFKNHNLKLVLQGHLHTIEDVYIDGIHFITGGAICARWWRGANMGFEEGFMYLTVKDDKVSWEYKDYGWNVEN